MMTGIHFTAFLDLEYIQILKDFFLHSSIKVISGIFSVGEVCFLYVEKV